MTSRSDYEFEVSDRATAAISEIFDAADEDILDEISEKYGNVRILEAKIVALFERALGKSQRHLVPGSEQQCAEVVSLAAWNRPSAHFTTASTSDQWAEEDRMCRGGISSSEIESSTTSYSPEYWSRRDPSFYQKKRAIVATSPQTLPCVPWQPIDNDVMVKRPNLIRNVSEFGYCQSRRCG
jgi:hypothetical protein